MLTDPIKHVVVLMPENHSFDQMLGWLKQAVLPDIEGVDPVHPATNADSDGDPYSQAPSTSTPDPMHELENVLRQIDYDNDGFVLDYWLAHPSTTTDQRQQVMGYFASPATIWSNGGFLATQPSAVSTL
jgi:phospholipase C